MMTCQTITLGPISKDKTGSMKPRSIKIKRFMLKYQEAITRRILMMEILTLPVLMMREPTLTTAIHMVFTIPILIMIRKLVPKRLTFAQLLRRVTGGTKNSIRK